MKKTGKRNPATAAAIMAAMSFYSGSVLAGGLLDVDFFNDVTFANPRGVDNPYWPLNPDNRPRTYSYTGETEDGCIINSIFVNGGPPGGPVTGVKTLTGAYAFLGEVLEVLDIEWVDEECDGNLLEAEVTFDWYVQDDFKNIWYMGEASRDFGYVEIDGEEIPCPTLTQVPLGLPEEDWGSYGFGGVFFAECTAGSWEAGIEGGQGDDAVVGEPGIIVPGDMPFGISGEPLANGAFYMQEVAYEAQDMAKILRQNASLSVDDGLPPGEYDKCRKVKEWNPYDHGDSVEHKWYCHDPDKPYGPGLVLIEGIGGGPNEAETLVQIDPEY